MRSTPISGRIVLAGNPNVGKSTLFNLLTGKKVHTGNWSGKTVSVSEGYGVHNSNTYIIEDIPGIASITCPDAEEIAAFNTVAQGNYDCLVLVADATNLYRSLSLLLRIAELTPKVVFFVNMYDEAQNHGITIDTAKLQFLTGVPIVIGSAHKKACLAPLWDAVEMVLSDSFSPSVFTPLYDDETESTLSSFSYDRKETLLHIYCSPDSYLPLKAQMAKCISSAASAIEDLCVTKVYPMSHTADKILTRPIFAIPFMLSLLFLILYITIAVSNYPSQLLSYGFSYLKIHLDNFFTYINLPYFLKSVLLDGIYATTSTVVAVMLPPMAIFFPLFAILEDSGILPRIAFNLDDTFKGCGSCGKQALTICMGLGCNCVGVVGSAIIPSKRERLISILTNSFTPCNGRFGAIIACISIFLAPGKPHLAALIMALVLVFSFSSTLFASWLLSSTLLKGKSAPFILELPPYRRVNLLKITASALTDRTWGLLLRAVAVSAPTGALICVLNHFNLLIPIADFLNPFATIMGLDGIILLAFILSFPANETVFPIALMLYTNSISMVESSHTALYSILDGNSWSIATAVCFITFTLMHWPCSTTLLTIHKETHSIKWTLLSILLPMLFGIIFCILFNLLFYVLI